MSEICSIDSVYLEDSLSDFNCSYTDGEEFVEKVNSLGCSFHLSKDELFDELMAFATNMKKSELDLAFLDNFQQYFLKKSTKIESSTNKRRTVLSEFRPSHSYQVKEDEAMDMTQSFVLPSVDGYEVPEYIKKFIPVESCAGSGWFMARTEPGKIMAKYIGKEATNGDILPRNEGKEKVSVVPLHGRYLGTGPPSYGNDKAAVVVNGLTSRLESYATAVRESNATVFGDSPFVSLHQHSEDEVLICGMVHMEVDCGRVEDASIFILIADEEDGPVSVKVDASSLEERCFFPGQMVVLRGVNKTGRLFEVNRQFEVDEKRGGGGEWGEVKRQKDDATVWVACGPFTPPSTASFEPLAELIEQTLKEKPSTLILVGPFVDRKNSFMTSRGCKMSDADMTKLIVERITSQLEGSSTRVYMIPSTSRDAAIVPCFPGGRLCIEGGQWSFGKDKTMELLTDPCIISVGGIEIAVTASEIVAHLSSSECFTSSNKENTDRMARLAGHVVRQSSLYPLHPPSLSVSLERLHESCTLQHRPHLIVAPCVLAPFIKNTNGVIVANPGPLCRGSSAGTILKIHFSLSSLPQEGTKDMRQFTMAHIVRI